jgi:hypothetical protein
MTIWVAATWWTGPGSMPRLPPPAGPPPGVRRYLSLDASGTFALSSAACFADAVGRAAELGFTDVFTHWPRPSGWYAGDESVLETVVADFVAASR